MTSYTYTLGLDIYLDYNKYLSQSQRRVLKNVNENMKTIGIVWLDHLIDKIYAYEL